MYEFTYESIHLPKCSYLTHLKDLVRTRQTIDVTSRHEAMELLMKWNCGVGHSDCFRFAPVSCVLKARK